MNLQTIQELKPSDSNKLSLIVEEWLKNYPEMKTMGVNWTEKSFKEELENGKSLALISDEGLILSFILFRLLSKNLVEINFLATVFNRAHQGYMDLLFKAFMQQNEGKEVWLEVHEKNSYALNFYKKIGFAEEGKRPKYYPDGSSAIMLNFRST